MNKSSVEIVSDIGQYVPSNYSPIIDAGGGVTGVVYFCLPRGAIEPAEEGIDGAAKLSKAKNSLVALKILHYDDEYDRSERFYGRQEVDALEHVWSNVQGTDKARLFQEIIGYNTTKQWIMSVAILDSMTLSEVVALFGKSKMPLPETFVWHLYLEMAETLMFLHDVVKRQHLDFHDGNILLRFTSGQPKITFPCVTIIDFDSSLPTKLNSSYSMDCADMFKLLLELCQCGRKCDCRSTGPGETTPQSKVACEHGEGWKDFISGLERARFNKTLTIAQFHEAHGAVAVRNRDSAAEEDIVLVNEMVSTILRSRRNQLDRNLEQVLGISDHDNSTIGSQ